MNLFPEFDCCARNCPGPDRNLREFREFNTIDVVSALVSSSVALSVDSTRSSLRELALARLSLARRSSSSSAPSSIADATAS